MAPKWPTTKKKSSANFNSVLPCVYVCLCVQISLIFPAFSKSTFAPQAFQGQQFQLGGGGGGGGSYKIFYWAMPTFMTHLLLGLIAMLCKSMIPANE